MVRDTGFEPVTPTVSRWCSTTELTAQSASGASLSGRYVALASAKMENACHDGGKFFS